MAKDKVQAARNTEIAPPVAEPEWARLLREQARDERSNLTVGVPRIKHKGTFLSIDGEKVKDNKLRAVILGMVWAKTWFEKEWTEGSTDTPGCYAFGTKEKGLVPSPASPKKQADQCDGCAHNKFNTALRGGGKRCSDRPRLALILADDLAKHGDEEVARAIAKAQIYQIEVPPASIKVLSKYVQALPANTHTGSLREAVTEIFATPRENGGHELVFTFLDKVPDPAMPAIIKKSEGVYDLLAQPYPVIAAKGEEKEAANDKPVKGQDTKKGRR